MNSFAKSSCFRHEVQRLVEGAIFPQLRLIEREGEEKRGGNGERTLEISMERTACFLTVEADKTGL